MQSDNTMFSKILQQFNDSAHKQFQQLIKNARQQ